MMQIYLVGGAVRDKYLNIPIKEKDWCVVGSSSNDLIEMGFKAVGKDFPVFLHPETKEEYALARIEKKIGPGYHGFSFLTSKEVSLQDDLKRRDLTINAMAIDNEGNLIDPHHGLNDLENKILRHVSNSFREDPVRVLRVAKFSARFHKKGFIIHPETLKMMKSMSKQGEIQNLVGDRVWKETEEALSSGDSHIFFRALQDCDALRIIFPEFYELDSSSKSNSTKIQEKYTFEILEHSSNNTNNPAINFSILVFDILKSRHKSSNAMQKAHKTLARELKNRLPIPSNFIDVSSLLIQFTELIENTVSLSPDSILMFLENADAFRRKKRFEEFLDAHRIISKKNKCSSSIILIKNIIEACDAIPMKKVIGDESNPKIIKEKVRKSRIEAIKSKINTK
ncbi:MAG: multifunctional CCA tRNA nucleotidyl transferase/2'3'-cyclic phosphodiesterase/2'nucleotidase/phosphatase [Gammaproteobacteria bacterium]|nr:MAG: multifunctional CCA tRNA nucleotidyl transferase/2'3'-cyclic phosphodiesterase/2'nucleotidase/phosphatase [Gammaproteobacteria bacterium]|tara:strand:+ start:4842 stop:6029 length:1188 start_codon:yes stop_codon:yes gene_type:complete